MCRAGYGLIIIQTENRCSKLHLGQMVRRSATFGMHAEDTAWSTATEGMNSKWRPTDTTNTVTYVTTGGERSWTGGPRETGSSNTYSKTVRKRGPDTSIISVAALSVAMKPIPTKRLQTPPDTDCYPLTFSTGPR